MPKKKSIGKVKHARNTTTLKELSPFDNYQEAKQRALSVATELILHYLSLGMSRDEIKSRMTLSQAQWNYFSLALIRKYNAKTLEQALFLHGVYTQKWNNYVKDVPGPINKEAKDG